MCNTFSLTVCVAEHSLCASDTSNFQLLPPNLLPLSPFNSCFLISLSLLLSSHISLRNHLSHSLSLCLAHTRSHRLISSHTQQSFQNHFLDSHLCPPHLWALYWEAERWQKNRHNCLGWWVIGKWMNCFLQAVWVSGRLLNNTEGQVQVLGCVFSCYSSVGDR